MNLNYEKIKERYEHGGNHWTSYSDLFLVLSVVFLLLFTLANLRSGAMTIAQQAQLQQFKQEAENYRKQIKTYDGLSDDYVKNGASKDEIQVYQQLMGHLDLLESDAKDEKAKAYQKAHEADAKEKALNEYQQMVKNIVNANLVASGRVKKRDFVIEEQDKDIDNLNKSVEADQGQIAKNNTQIEQIQTKLEKQIQDARWAATSHKRSKEKMEADVARLRQESESKITALNQQNNQFMSKLGQTQAELEAKNRESEGLMKSLSDKEASLQGTISELQNTQAVADKQKADFQANLARVKMSEEAKLAREQAFARDAEGKNRAYQAQMAALSSSLENTRSSQKAAEGKYQNSIHALENMNSNLKSDLNASLNKLNQQRQLAAQLEENFRKAGIKASVDQKTGDVTIDFQNEYFDSGSADLKEGMKAIIEKALPPYAQSLMQDPKIAKRISSVEIIGFASPTYKGKAVDPESLSADNRGAVNYNMDLSYKRAKTIFEYAFTSKMSFPYQKEVLPLVKVSGRSYLATEKTTNRSTASGDDICSKFDCKKSQRVIVKFNLKDE